MRIACLHTVDSNIAVFEAAASGLPGVTLTHHVRADLLKRAEAAGQLTDEIRDEAAASRKTLDEEYNTKRDGLQALLPELENLCWRMQATSSPVISIANC